MNQPTVYLMTNRFRGVLYIGVTSNLAKRVWEHKNSNAGSFTAKFYLFKLVYFELMEDMYTAISREKQLKNWKRQWKIELIESINPEWRDLYSDIM